MRLRYRDRFRCEARVRDPQCRSRVQELLSQRAVYHLVWFWVVMIELPCDDEVTIIDWGLRSEERTPAVRLASFSGNSIGRYHSSPWDICRLVGIFQCTRSNVSTSSLCSEALGNVIIVQDTTDMTYLPPQYGSAWTIIPMRFERAGEAVAARSAPRRLEDCIAITIKTIIISLGSSSIDISPNLSQHTCPVTKKYIATARDYANWASNLYLNETIPETWTLRRRKKLLVLFSSNILPFALLFLF
jgi:hypothetical protein